MSKMDRQLNSKKDKETIYEIYRACRLCGAGAGYKMPIIQNVVDLDDTDVELRQKLRDCVQIEVHQDDKMPPLICELCVDKVNDFYEFLEMCRQTNKRTRLRLGLPPQSMPRGAPDAGECILGLTEPVYVNEDSDGEPLSKQKKITPKVKVKREPELKVRLEKKILTETRPSRLTRRAATPPRVTRHRTNSKEENVSLSRLKDTKSPKPSPKSILKKETKNEDKSLLTPRLKRTRDKEPVKLETPLKRVKITTRTSSSLSSPQTPKSSPKISPQTPKSSPKISLRTAIKTSKSPKLSPVRPPSPPRVFKCSICGQASKTSQANGNHLRSHTVGFTNPKLACNPCGLWFPSADDAAAHHKQHRNKSKPYNCTRCDTDFRHLTSYDDHLQNNQCIPFDEVPDVKCEECWHLFATNKLLEDHKCLGEDHRPGGKCGKCRRSYALLKNLKKHELTCTAKKKGELIVDPVLLGKVKPIQIRMSRCDPLLTNLKQEHYDVSNVTADFGLDKNCVYPYISSVSLRIKSDPDGMVDIQDEIKNEFYTEEDYVHWDSEDSETDEESSVKKKIDTLANLTLKTLFSKKCLGKVPKKKRRVKQEKNMFDSLLTGIEDDISRDINNIIDNLGGDDDEFDGKKDDGKELNDSDKIMDVSDDKVTDKVDENDSSDKNDVTDSLDVKNDICDEEVTKDEEKDVNSGSKNENSVCNDDTEGSNNNLSSNNDNNSVKDKVNNGTINLNSLSFDYDDGVVISKKNYDVSSPLSKDENENDGSETNESKNDENTKIDFENSQDSNSIGSDSLLNTQNDKENIDKISIDNATSQSEQNTDVDENKSQSVENLSQDSKPSEFEEDKSQNNDKETDNSQNSDNITENDHKNAISVIVKTKASTESEELEDSKLMAALDAQIGESNENSHNVINENSRELSENSQEQINENSREQTNENSQEQINENSQEQINQNSRDQTNENSGEQINENSREQTNENSQEQINENSRDQTNENSQEQINENSRDQTNENSRDQTNENSREQINEKSREQTNENSREQIIDNFNNDKIALEDLITSKNSDLDMIPEEFNFDA